VLKEWIDAMTEELPELTSFILQTESIASSNLHVAWTMCRRADRSMVPLVQEVETCDPDALAYVKRLSTTIHSC
jgi:cob(I)alamin adenosyltransferase